MANSIRVKPPLSIFEILFLLKKVNTKNKLNLKKRAISLLVDLAIYALAAGLAQTMSTEQRFRHCYKQGILNKETLNNVRYINLSAICVLNINQTHCNNSELTNHIDPSDLSTSLERNHLKRCFSLNCPISRGSRDTFFTTRNNEMIKNFLNKFHPLNKLEKQRKIFINQDNLPVQWKRLFEKPYLKVPQI